jgi:hypothetical protein
MKGSIWRIRLGDNAAHELVAEQGSHLRLVDLTSGQTFALTSGNSVNVEPEWSS